MTLFLHLFRRLAGNAFGGHGWIRQGRVLLALSVIPAGAVEYREGAAVRYYERQGEDVARFELRVEDDGFLSIEVGVFDLNGFPATVFASGPVVVEERTGEGAADYSGRSTFDGVPVSWKVRIHRDFSAFTWSAPDSVLLRDGRRIDLAGTFVETPDAGRRKRAADAFARHDTELNRVYGTLRKTLDEERFRQLQANQRAWLTYRDYITYDGDNSGQVGPGTIAHIWSQAARSHDRVLYLQAFGLAEAEGPEGSTHSLSGLYSDGAGNRLSFRESVEGVAFFQLESLWTWHPPGDLSNRFYTGLWGVAKAVDGDIWTAEAKDCGAFSFTGTPLPSRIEFRRAGTGSLEVRSSGVSSDGEASSPAFDGDYLHQAELTAADDPVRRIFASLPPSVFDESVEPPDAGEVLELAASGTLLLNGEGPERWRRFSLEEEGPDFLRFRIPFGEFVLRRFPRSDGTALVVVTQSREQVTSRSFWESGPQGQFKRVDPSGILPEIRPGDFYRIPVVAEDASNRFGQPLETATFLLSKPSTANAIEIHYPSAPTDQKPDTYLILPWTGSGFGFERVETSR